MEFPKELFSKNWTPGYDPSPSTFDYFNKRFRGMKGYNWWLLPSVNERGTPIHQGILKNSIVTMKFTYHGEFKSRIWSDSWERVCILVQRGCVLYELYLDEDNYLFGSMASETTVGRLLHVHHLWDGTAELDTRSIFEHHPLTVRMEL